MYRRFQLSNVWREMDQLQREMNRLLGLSLGQTVFSSPSFPAINIWTSEDGQIISAEMPGIDPEDIEINVRADQVTLSGQRKFDALGDDVRYHRQERGYGKFTRSLQLPFMVDTDKVDAKFTDGILQIKLARAEADKPKKIAIKRK